MRIDSEASKPEEAGSDDASHARLEETHAFEGALASEADVIEAAGHALSADAAAERIRTHFRAARRRISTLTMLEPTALPGLASVHADTELAAVLSAVNKAGWTSTSMRKAAATLNSGIAWRKENRSKVFAPAIAGEKSDPTHHDAFFRVIRVEGPSQTLFAGSVLKGLLALRQEILNAPSTLAAPELRDIEIALRSMLMAEPSGKSAATLLTGQRRWKKPAFENVAARWIRGHQIFAVLNQGLVAAFIDLEDGIKAGDKPASIRAAGLVALLLRGSDVSMRLTGDFPVEYYDTFIKTSMEPPHMPLGFSGLLSLDHSALVRRMREAKPILDELKSLDASSHAAIGTALTGVYDSHKSVCAKFAGVERQSLLMATSCGRSAVDQLEAFKKSRLRATGLSAGHEHG